MKISLDEILGRRIEYPAEVVLSNGERFLLSTREQAHRAPNKRDVILYPDEGALVVQIAPEDVAEVRQGVDLL